MSWTIILPIILLSVPSVLLGAYVLLSDHYRRRTPPELRGDWWQRFEREFRAYVDETARPARKPPGPKQTPRARPAAPPPR